MSVAACSNARSTDRFCMESLDQWFRTWGFSDPDLGGFVDLWIREWVMDTLHWWHEDPLHEGWFHRSPDPFLESFSIIDCENELIGTRGARPYETEPLILDFGAPIHSEPTFSWKKRKEQAHAWLDMKLRSEREKVIGHAAAARMGRTSQRREPAHFVWLARRFLGESCVAIRRSLGAPKRERSDLSPRVVQKATKELAAFIGLSLPGATSRKGRT